jgi:hypothetical protein
MLPLMQGSVRLDNINLFSIITIMSFFILAPVTLLLEGVKFTPSAMQSMGILNSTEVIKKTLLAGVCFHAYQQVILMLHDTMEWPHNCCQTMKGFVLPTLHTRY